jgi:hypothetical protein
MHFAQLGQSETLLRLAAPLTQDHHATKILDQFQQDVESASHNEITIQRPYNARSRDALHLGVYRKKYLRPFFRRTQQREGAIGGAV